jgi:predicted DNA-binding transcriptional regulator AlpA
MSNTKKKQRPLDRIAYLRDEAAATLGLSTSTFNNWISRGLMPSGRRIYGTRLWDADEIYSAWLDIMDNTDEEAPIKENPFDQITG